MSRMVPEEYFDKNKSQAEQLLFDKLQNTFDENWLILHSFSFESVNLKNKLIDCEIDFLIFNKELGILVLEVKGGNIEYCNGKWYQNSKPIDDPYEQARANKYKITQFLHKYFNTNPPVQIGHAVCFPNCFSNDAPFIHQDITITGEHLEFLPEYITSLMEKSQSAKYKLNSDLVRSIEKALIPVFATNRTFKDKFGIEKDKIYSLTEEQCEILNFISNYNEALIQGCAGSGKTILAVKKAKELSLKGKQVLFLCYNNMLAERLKDETESYNSIRVETYHQLCAGEIEKAGIKITEYADSKELFQKLIPEKFFDLIVENPMKFDAVIVDEGQDFLKEYWIIVQELIKEGGCFYIFYDPEQNIFNKEISLPELKHPPFIMKKNYRNTIQIFNYMKQFASTEMKIHPQSPEGTEVIHYKTRKPTRNVLSEILHDLVKNNQIEEEQIVILGIHKLSNTSLGEENKAGIFTIKENGPADTHTIPYYTCMKYKGLESDVVILLDYEDERWNKNSIKYTAISRAKHKLYVIKTES